MVRTMVIALAVVTFVAGIQVPDGIGQSSEPKYNLTQESNSTGEPQETSSGAEVSRDSVEPTETPSTATQKSSTTGGQHQRSSGVHDSVESAETFSQPPSPSSQASRSPGGQPEGPDSTESPIKDSNPDCNVTDERSHMYLSCTYVCQGDEVIVAPDNSSCYMPTANNTLAPIYITEVPNGIKGRCENGDCVGTDTEQSIAID
ncbi:uncharacterized protein [Dermacentor albipictus]|uniref:uncharacterized protein isoform X2 n=1 Tax=Dermacentor albipictus TaxID=60249 RepID=UPI0031FCDDCA